MTVNLDGAASRNFHLTDRRDTQQLHTSVRRPDRCCPARGSIPTQNWVLCFQNWTELPPSTDFPALARTPNRLISCHCQPRSIYSWTTSRKTTNQQSSKLKVASIVSDKRAFLIGLGDVSLNPVTRDFAYLVAKWIPRTVHISVPRKGMQRELWNPPWLAGGDATFQEGKDLLPGALFVLECWTHPSPPPLPLSLSQQSSHAALPLLCTLIPSRQRPSTYITL